MITFSSVTKRFDGAAALSKLDFTVQKGEIIGFLGPNGAGKTTTMKLLLGQLEATDGSVRVNGKDPLHERLAIASIVGYLPENNPLYGEMTPEEYCSFVAEVKGASLEQLAVLAEEVEIKSVFKKKIETLSRGFKQRVGLVAALLGNPSILLLDEPTSGLDPIEQEKIRSLIVQSSEEKAVIFSTHILSEVEAIATRLIILDRGEILYDGKKPAGNGKVEQLFRDLVKRHENIA